MYTLSIRALFLLVVFMQICALGLGHKSFSALIMWSTVCLLELPPLIAKIMGVDLLHLQTLGHLKYRSTLSYFMQRAKY